MLSSIIQAGIILAGLVAYAAAILVAAGWVIWWGLR